MNASSEEEAVRRRLRDDYVHYAERCLVIRPKEGGVVPFKLNKAQLYIHEQAEDQRKRTGKVRKIVLKGRQQGCSTYVQGRIYHKITHRKGYRAFVLAHEQDATDRMFEMAERFHENCPPPLRPVTGAANAKELNFSALDSGYEIGTAGNAAVGRSATIQIFHGSEVAFWKNAANHAAGVLQTVPDAPDTEVWLESTANGVGNYYHEMVLRAIAGETDFEFIFIPWFWQEEYRKDVPVGFAPAKEEIELKEMYGLDDQQLVWRRNKIGELGSEEAFRKEYPNNQEEAFRAVVQGSYYGSLIERASIEGRIRNVPWDRALPVYSFWDLGYGDDTAIWFLQKIASELHLIDALAGSGLDISYYVTELGKKPYTYKEHIMPHDAANGSLIGSGKTLKETAEALGLKPIRVLPRLGIDHGINAVRQILPRCWFDKKNCEGAPLDALRQYRRKYNEHLQSFMPTPVHDWASHYADAFRTVAMGLKEGDAPTPRQRYTSRREQTSTSWMAA